jgi:hypothetical protein
MRRTSYLKRASKRFLEGTRCKSPIEAVDSGQRPLTLWAEILSQEREVEQAYQQTRRRPLRAPSNQQTPSW